MKYKVVCAFLCAIFFNLYATMDLSVAGLLNVHTPCCAINEIERLCVDLKSGKITEMVPELEFELISCLQKIQSDIRRFDAEYMQVITECYLSDGLPSGRELGGEEALCVEFLRCVGFVLATEALILTYKMIGHLSSTFQNKVKQSEVFMLLKKTHDEIKDENEVRNKHPESWSHNLLFNKALYYACLLGAYETVNFLLSSYYIDPNNCVHQTFGYSPALWPVVHNDVKMLELLILNGMRLDLQDVSGDTVLHWASRLYNEDVIKILLKWGASNNIKNNLFQLPMQLCEAAVDLKVHVSLFRTYGYQIKICEISKPE